MKTIVASRNLFLVFSGLVICHNIAATTATSSFTEAAQRWIESEFQPSTLSKQQQMEELAWFINASAPYRGMTVRVLSEIIDTHQYESTVLAQAFAEITGIDVVHDTRHEGDVVNTLLRQFETGDNLYDGYISDSDLIGTHFRHDYVYPLSDYIDGEGRNVTLPTLDLPDFIGTSFTTAPDGKLYQLPDQQFANLYWYRADWFDDDSIRSQFAEIYGYELGVPVNWKAYEDIANFFTHQVNGDGTIDGAKVYGHMDYGATDPSLGWRFTDAWLSMAGAGDEGIPNGLPVDEWGIRADSNGCTPVGSSVSRGGATNGPAAVYAVEKYLKWLNEYAPVEARDMTFSEAGPVPSQGNVAQQIFWYTTFTKSMTASSAVTNEDGTPKWRVAPSPHGAYWSEGMKKGYQDCGSWTLLRHTPASNRAAVWLYAQFVVSKTTSLKKSIEGLTFIRESDILSEYFTTKAPSFGGLIEFYRGPARLLNTPTGVNVPDYPLMTPLWWQNIGPAIRGELTAQEAMDNLAAAQDRVLEEIAMSGHLTKCAPNLNELQGAQYWLDQPGSPKPTLEDEDGVPETISYDELLNSWDIGSDVEEAKEGDFDRGESSSAKYVCGSTIVPATTFFTAFILMQSVW